MKQIKQIFLEGESPTSRQKFFGTFQKFFLQRLSKFTMDEKRKAANKVKKVPFDNEKKKALKKV